MIMFLFKVSVKSIGEKLQRQSSLANFKCDLDQRRNFKVRLSGLNVILKNLHLNLCLVQMENLSMKNMCNCGKSC